MRSLARVALIMLGFCLPSATRAADPAASFGGVEIEAAPAPAHLVTNDDLGHMPAVDLPLTLGTEHDPHQATYHGPLLWTVLTQAGAGGGSPRDVGHQYVVVTGHDGYSIVLSLGEVAPSLEGKQVVLADSVDGKPLPPGRWRLVVPGDHAAARSVRDVARLAVVAIPGGS